MGGRAGGNAYVVHARVVCEPMACHEAQRGESRRRCGDRSRYYPSQSKQGKGTVHVACIVHHRWTDGLTLSERAEPANLGFVHPNRVEVDETQRRSTEDYGR